MNIKSIMLTVSAMVLILVVVLFRAEPQVGSIPTDSSADLTDVQQKSHEYISPVEIQSTNTETSNPKVQLTENVVTGNSDITEFAESEYVKREDMAIEPEIFADDNEVVVSVSDREIELNQLLMNSNIDDEKIDEIFSAIRSGTEEDIDATEPTNDYPQRLKAIVDLLDQWDMDSSGMESDQVVAVIKDIFPTQSKQTE